MPVMNSAKEQLCSVYTGTPASSPTRIAILRASQRVSHPKMNGRYAPILSDRMMRTNAHHQRPKPLAARWLWRLNTKRGLRRSPLEVIFPWPTASADTTPAGPDRLHGIVLLGKRPGTFYCGAKWPRRSMRRYHARSVPAGPRIALLSPSNRICYNLRAVEMHPLDHETPAPARQRSESSRADTLRADEPCEFCPQCSARLAARSCKLVCASCGYYMSCSDFY